MCSRYDFAKLFCVQWYLNTSSNPCVNSRLDPIWTGNYECTSSFTPLLLSQTTHYFLTSLISHKMAYTSSNWIKKVHSITNRNWHWTIKLNDSCQLKFLENKSSEVSHRSDYAQHYMQLAVCSEHFSYKINMLLCYFSLPHRR